MQCVVYRKWKRNAVRRERDQTKRTEVTSFILSVKRSLLTKARGTPCDRVSLRVSYGKDEIEKKPRNTALPVARTAPRSRICQRIRSAGYFEAIFDYTVALPATHPAAMAVCLHEIRKTRIWFP